MKKAKRKFLERKRRIRREKNRVAWRKSMERKESKGS